MGQFIDISGQRYGRLIAIVRDKTKAKASGGKRVFWICACDCGNSVSVTAHNLRQGIATSCGCRKSEVTIARSTTHGMSKTPTYKLYRDMISRCEIPSSTSYRFYGGKGVKVAQRWRESFENFLTDMGERPDGMSLDRYPDPYGDYAPDNCRWASDAEQHRNLRRNRTWRGQSLPVSEIARLNGVPRTTLNQLLLKGMSVESAVSHAVAHRKAGPIRAGH